MNLVRELAKDKDPMVRTTAAQLLAPHDPAAATEVLQALMADPNPAIRELAGRTASRELPPDPRTLRGLLRNPDALVRVRAANKILALIR
jgi:HEAT repeat protein